MYHSLSNSLTRALPFATALALLSASAPAHAHAQKMQTKPAATSAVEIVSQQVSTSRAAASLHLELSNGHTVDIAMRSGQAYLNGKRVGDAPRGSNLDDSFRSLLTDLTNAKATDTPRLLTDWSPEPNGPAPILDRALEDAVRGMASTPAAPDAEGAAPANAAPQLNADGTPVEDSVNRLNERINELQSMVDDMNDDESSASAHITGRRPYRTGPLHSLVSGISDIFSVIVLYFVILVIAVVIIAFGGRKYIEGVAETARLMTMRSWLVGLAGQFLVIPAFVLGIIALAISIVGIPVLLAWVPLYPIAVIASAILGFLAIAHAAGESMSEKRFYENSYFQRGNSYYFLLTGVGLLLAPFIGAGVIRMAGPWLGIIHGLLIFLGVVAMWAAFTVGFGAVLVSRAGTRPLGKIPTMDSTFAEDLDV